MLKTKYILPYLYFHRTTLYAIGNRTYYVRLYSRKVVWFFFFGIPRRFLQRKSRNTTLRIVDTSSDVFSTFFRGAPNLFLIPTLYTYIKQTTVVIQ